MKPRFGFPTFSSRDYRYQNDEYTRGPNGRQVYNGSSFTREIPSAVRSVHELNRMEMARFRQQHHETPRQPSYEPNAHDRAALEHSIAAASAVASCTLNSGLAVEDANIGNVPGAIKNTAYAGIDAGFAASEGKKAYQEHNKANEQRAQESK